MSASSFTMELFTISETSIFLSGLWMTQDPVREECADEVPEIIKEIGGAVDRVNALLRQLHRMPRSPKKRRTAVDRKMLARMRFSAGALGASNELVTAVASNLPPIYCLESEFENVVLNLAIKARDAMLKRGRVTIEPVCGATSNVVIRVHATRVWG
jgi:hypothetical protein